MNPLFTLFDSLPTETLAQPDGFVANYGVDSRDCGFNESLPCRTIAYLADLMDTYTHIYVLPTGPGAAQSVYDPGGDTFLLQRKGFLRIYGSNGDVHPSNCVQVIFCNHGAFPFFGSKYPSTNLFCQAVFFFWQFDCLTAYNHQLQLDVQKL